MKLKEQTGVHFRLEEGSNYEVMMTYDRSEVIVFEQFKKLARVLNDDNQRFVTINKRIVNKSTIIDIAPTKKKTEGQIRDYENERMEENRVLLAGKPPVKESELKKRRQKIKEIKDSLYKKMGWGGIKSKA